MASIDTLRASDGSGNASVATVQSPRSAMATTLVVDTVQGINGTFHATMGTPHTFVDPVTSETITVISEASAVDFQGHVDGGNLEIDTIAPGYTDAGSSVNDIVIIKPTTQWADEVADVLDVEHNDDGTHSSSTTVGGRTVTNFAPSGMIVPYAGSSAPIDWLMCDGAAVSRTTYSALFATIADTYGAGDGSTTFNLPDLRSRVPIGAGAAPTKVATFVSRSGNVVTLSGIDNTLKNEFQTGQEVVFTSSGTTIGGLTSGGTYYLIRTGNLTFSLASSRVNASDGTAITLSSDGTGTRIFTLTLSAKALAETGGEESHTPTLAETYRHSHGFPGGATGGVAANPGSNINAQFTNGTGGITGWNGNNNGGGNFQTRGSSDAFNVLNPYLALNYIIKT